MREGSKVVNPANAATWQRGNTDLPTFFPEGNAAISALPKRGNVGKRFGPQAEDRNRMTMQRAEAARGFSPP